MVIRFLTAIVAIAAVAALLFYLYIPVGIVSEPYQSAPASSVPDTSIPVDEAQSQLSEDEVIPSFFFAKAYSNPYRNTHAPGSEIILSPGIAIWSRASP